MRILPATLFAWFLVLGTDVGQTPGGTTPVANIEWLHPMTDQAACRNAMLEWRIAFASQQTDAAGWKKCEDR